MYIKCYIAKGASFCLKLTSFPMLLISVIDTPIYLTLCNNMKTLELFMFDFLPLFIQLI